MTFDQLLHRADEETLGEILGRDSIRLIGILNQSSLKLSVLKDILLSLQSPEELLLAPRTRRLLLDLMRLEEAQLLGKTLGITGTNIFEKLSITKFKRKSARAHTLLNFFGLLHPADEVQEILPATQQGKANYSLFKHQRIAALRTTKNLDSNGRVLLHMPTGSGKTRTAMNIACEYLRKNETGIVVWFAFNEELCEQAASEFEKAWSFLGNRQVSIHRLWGVYNQELADIQDGILVAGLAKLGSLLNRTPAALSQLGSRTTLLIIDEAHQAIAPSYSLLLNAFYSLKTNSRLLGLSATPGRSWNDINEDQELADFFFGCKVTLDVDGYTNPVKYLIDSGYLANAKFEKLSYKPEALNAEELAHLSQLLEVSEDILSTLAVNETRNLTILNKVEELTNKHKRIIVFASTVNHAELLAIVLRARGVNASSITGSTPSITRSRIISEFKDDTPETKVLCNYGVLTTGFDAPRTSAAIIARPTKSLVLYSQMVGRAIRGIKAGGNLEAEIITVVDFDLPGFDSIESAFVNWEDVWTV